MTNTCITPSESALGNGHRDYYISIPASQDGERHSSESIWNIIEAFERLYANHPIHRINGKRRDYLCWGRTSDEHGQDRVLISLPTVPNQTPDEVILHLSKLMDQAVKASEAFR